MGLEIRQTYARIGIETTPAKLEMQSQLARLELHQKHAKVNIHTEPVRVEIDQYEAFASAGLKNNADLIREAAQRGYQQALEYIGKYAEDGDMLAAIERGGNPLADIAERDSHTEHEFGMDTIPKAGPKFNVTGSVQIQAEPNWEGIHNGVEGRYIPGQLNCSYTPGMVRIYLQQYPSISLNYVGGSIDTRI